MAEQLLATALHQMRSGDLQTAYETLWVACHDGPAMVEAIATNTRYDTFIDVLPGAFRHAIRERRRGNILDTVNFALINRSLLCEEAMNDAEEEQARWRLEQEEDQFALQWITKQAATIGQ
jgi:hypothetical protein